MTKQVAEAQIKESGAPTFQTLRMRVKNAERKEGNRTEERTKVQFTDVERYGGRGHEGGR